MADSFEEGGRAHWRIEALDARAGLAFAAWRADRAHSLSMADSSPCLHFSPPFFKAESLAGPGLAWAAARGSFAPELLLEGGQEAWFERPEEVAEFVRRSYVSGSAGDGGDGGDDNGEPSPQPPEGGPEVGNYEGDPSRLSNSLLEFVQRFERAARDVRLGKVVATSWQPSAQGGDGSVLIRGALSTLFELLRRKPQKEEPGSRRWYEDFASFVQVAGPAGLYAARRQSAYSKALAENSAYDEDLFDYWVYRHHRTLLAPLQCLRRMPLPWFARFAVPGVQQGSESLYHLLNAFVATPDKVAKGRYQTEIIELVLFAAAVLVSASSRAHGLSQLQLILHGPYDLLGFTDDLAHEAAQWLAEHLPAMAFTFELESRIFDSQFLRYRS